MGGGCYGKPTRDGASPDMPRVHAAHWVQQCGGVGAPLGKAEPGTKAVVIRAGLTGVVLSKQLALAGFEVTLVEAFPEAGGRLISQELEEDLFAVPAAMRFGEASDLADMFVKPYGYTITDGLPMANANVVPTLMFDTEDGVPVLRDDKRGIMPDAYLNASAGMKALFEQPIFHDGLFMFPPLNDFRMLLENPNADPIALLEIGQRVYNYVAGLDIEEFYTKVFVDNGTPPGSVSWSEDDVACALQLPATGRHDTFSDISAWTDMKWFLTGSVVNQTCLTKGGKMADAHELVLDMAAELGGLGVEEHYGTRVAGVDKDLKRVNATQNGRAVSFDYDVVLVTTTVPGAVKMGLAETGANQILSDEVCAALKEINCPQTSKIEWVVSAQPWIDDPYLPRNIQMPSPFCPFYMLFNDGDEYARVHCYAWASDGPSLEAKGDANDIRKAIIANGHDLLDDTQFSAIADAIDDTSRVAAVKHWHSDPLAGGGWTFPTAGPDGLVLDILHNLSDDSSVFLCGSAAVGEGNWLVDGLRGVCLGLGAALKATGGEISCPEWAPINRLGFHINYSEGREAVCSTVYSGNTGVSPMGYGTCGIDASNAYSSSSSTPPALTASGTFPSLLGRIHMFSIPTNPIPSKPCA
ncbi:unnamed protein product [Polarella glacialis]|uniref:Amine oxidase domain-containing protein n=1 Tax=Polarella glacialis TaxID=89957 RepID=A0A813JZX6_POLGL|nr:unnamed protein product [Polarella glacialis]